MYSKKFFTLAIGLGLLFALVVPTFAQDTSPTPNPTTSATTDETRAPMAATSNLFVTPQFRVNVRSGPGTQYTILDQVTTADSLDITGQDADGGWLRVNFNGQEGWLFANLGNVTGDITTASVVEAGPTAVLRDGSTPVTTDAQTGTDATGDVLIVTRFNTNLRSTTSLSADVLDVIPFNTELQPAARSENGNWVMVTFGDQSGWVWSPILFFSNGEVASLPVMAADTTTTTNAAATQEALAQTTPAP